MLGRAGLITLSTDTFTVQRRDRALPMLALENSILSKHRPPGALGEDEGERHGKKESGKERIRRDQLSFSCYSGCGISELYYTLDSLIIRPILKVFLCIESYLYPNKFFQLKCWFHQTN